MSGDAFAEGGCSEDSKLSPAQLTPLTCGINSRVNLATAWPLKLVVPTRELFVRDRRAGHSIKANCRSAERCSPRTHRHLAPQPAAACSPRREARCTAWNLRMSIPMLCLPSSREREGIRLRSRGRPRRTESRQRALPALQAQATPEVLERRLLKFLREARVIEEEQGVNILYLAFGFLKWFEDPRSDEVCWAPLILLPVVIERRQGREQFVLRARDDDLMVNVLLRRSFAPSARSSFRSCPKEMTGWRRPISMQLRRPFRERRAGKSTAQVAAWAFSRSRSS